MRLRDENKRREIIRAAAQLFAEQPFHKVRLDDVAKVAGIGKGTVYIYFKNKEELYYSLVYDGLAALVDKLKGELAENGLSVDTRLKMAIRAIVAFCVQHPQLFEVMRTVGVPDASTDWDKKRRELMELVEGVLAQAIATGDIRNDRPDWVAVYLAGMVRAVMLYRPGEASADELAEHVFRTVWRGIATGSKK